MQKRIIDEYGQSKYHMDLRFKLVCVLGLSGFMRISEIQSLQMKNISFMDKGLKILLRHLKRIILGKVKEESPSNKNRLQHNWKV